MPIDGTYDLGKGPKSTPEHQQHAIQALSECMSCGCCLEACPQYTLEASPARSGTTSFLGAHADQPGPAVQRAPDRQACSRSPSAWTNSPAWAAINDCGNAQNCVKVCPKEIPLTESIAAMGRQVTVHAVKRFFSGRK